MSTVVCVNKNPFRVLTGMSRMMLSRDPITKSLRQITINHHYPYWVLSTAILNRYQANDLNRFALDEVLMSHAHPDPKGRYPLVPHEEQVVNEVLLSGIMRTLRLMLGGIAPASIPSVWMEKSKKGKLGLNYQQTVQDWGLA